MENQEDKIESNGRGAPVGNKNAAKGAQLTAMLSAALDANDKQRLRQGVDNISKAFAEGERWAVEFVFDRIEGKAVARTELSGVDGANLPISIGLSFVEPERTISEEA
jgi:hypothetical protein